MRYEITLEHSGTFGYHPRRDAAHSIDLGPYGLLVVDEPGEPQTDSEVALVFDAFGEAVPLTVIPSGEGHTGHSHADVNRTWTVNGLLSAEVHVAPATTIRARLLNASSAGYFALGLTGVHADSDGGTHPEPSPLRQIAADQGLLPSLHTARPLLLPPGDRAEAWYRFTVTLGASAAQPQTARRILRALSPIGVAWADDYIHPVVLRQFDTGGGGHIEIHPDPQALPIERTQSAAVDLVIPVGSGLKIYPVIEGEVGNLSSTTSSTPATPTHMH